MEAQLIRSNEEIRQVLAARPGVWRWVRWVRGRRPRLTAIIVLAAPAYTVSFGPAPYDLLVPSNSWRFLVPWFLIALGILFRIWGSGNLRKNQEITATGAYCLVRHPLYFGSLCLLLAYFLTACDPKVGVLLFITLVLLVFYPTMLSEEAFLLLKFPGEMRSYQPRPRFLPDLRRVSEALRTDRFAWRDAYGNLGFRSLWFIPALPLFLRLTSWVREVVLS